MCDDIDVHLGKRLRQRRHLLGLTQTQLAEACGLRFQQIQKYEAAASRITASRLWQLAEALEAPVDYFYDGLANKQLVEKALKAEDGDSSPGARLWQVK